MKIASSYSFEELQRICRQMDAPVFPRRKFSPTNVFLVRRQGYTTQDIENFFARLTNGERTVNEQ